MAVAAKEVQKESMEGDDREGIVMKIWCECFSNERQNIKRYDSYEIEGILTRIGGWNRYIISKSGKSKFPLYGVQKTFMRGNLVS